MLAGLLLIATTGLSGGEGLSEAEILAGADARIREHRTSEVVLRVLDEEGRSLSSGTAVSVEQTRHAFLFGCNIFALGRSRTPEDNVAYERQFAALLNYATLPFYWWSYERERGKPDDERTEEIVRWCRARGIVTKGHPLAWNYRDVPWLPDDPEEVARLQMERIGDCVRRFRGKIDIWDVVNEAAHYDREHVRSQAPRLTRAIDHMGVGPYVRAAFGAARAASSDAALVINDYRLDPEYETRVIRELVADDGSPLYDVIGLQSHQHGGARPVAQIWEVCERFGRYGKPLHWTETTFVSGEEGWDLPRARRGFEWRSTPEGEKRQAEDAARFYTVLFSHPAVEAITWWDFSDQRAWQSAPAGLLRADMTPKPAYDELHGLIKGKWWTRLEATAGDRGDVRVRGFHGDYRVGAKVGDRELSASFRLRRDSPGTIEVRLRAPE